MSGEGRLNGTLRGVEELIGYARCSTVLQDLTAQREILTGLGVAADRIYLDQGLRGDRIPLADQVVRRRLEPDHPGLRPLADEAADTVTRAARRKRRRDGDNFRYRLRPIPGRPRKSGLATDRRASSLRQGSGA